MLAGLLLLPGCLTLGGGTCEEGQYLTLKGDCVTSDLVYDSGLDVETDADADSDADADADADADTDADADADADADSDGPQMLDVVDISCDAGSWYYHIETATPTESASFELVNTASGAFEAENHTLTISGEAPGGGETYIQTLLLVAGYFFEDVATQFSCTSTTNTDLTWKINLFSNTDRTGSVGCVSYGHSPDYFDLDGCQHFTGSR